MILPAQRSSLVMEHYTGRILATHTYTDRHTHTRAHQVYPIIGDILVRVISFEFLHQFGIDSFGKSIELASISRFFFKLRKESARRARKVPSSSGFRSKLETLTLFVSSGSCATESKKSKEV